MRTLSKALFIVVAVMLFHFKSGATLFTVSVSSNQFTPANIPNVVVGDTIRWVWQSGPHTTTCDPGINGADNSLPAGAATWDAPINASNTTFDYKVTVAGGYNYWCNIHGTSMIGSFTASAALPVKLTEFKIASENNNAVLNWTTSSEENTDYFSVLRSKTGSDYTEIAKVPAAGTSSVTRSYSYADPASSADKFYYYMVAVVYKDGKKELSTVQLYRNTASIAKLIMSMSPNPVSRSGHLMLKFNADKAGKMDVKIANLEGKYLIKTSLQASEGVNNGHLMLDALPAGTYSVIFTLNGIKEVHKLTVN